MKNMIMTIAMVFMIVSCSSATKKQIEIEKNEVGPVDSNQEMVNKTKNILKDSKNLSEEQKKKFLNLHQRVMATVSAINAELRKTKVVYFENMLSKKYDKKKMALLLKDIRKLYDKRLDVMLNAMNESKEILGIHTSDIYHKTFLDQHFFNQLKD